MSKEIEILLPKLGESIVSATVVRWLKQEGEPLAVDEPIVEVATDKVNSEIPSPCSGRFVRPLVPVDGVVEVGHPLAIVDTSDEVAFTARKPSCPQVTLASGSEATTGFLSPAVLRLAQESGLSIDEVKRIQGSGRGGRVTKQDIENQLARQAEVRLEEGDQRLPLSPMRRAIADAMVRSVREAPHAYLVAEIDMTKIVEGLPKERERFLKEHGAKLTLTSYLLRAIARAALRYPEVNSTLHRGDLIVRKRVNIGIAVEVPEGLMVPVLPDCQERELPSLALGLADLATRARNRQLLPDDVQGGTITLTNFGMSGAKIGFPILRPGETAIIGAGLLEKGVKVVGGELVVRDLIQITLGFDHRVLDGMVAGAFLKAIGEELQL